MARVTRTMSLGDAVSWGFGELQSLAEEVREVVDNAEGGRAETQRIQTLGETADTLEGLDEPEVPEALSDIQVSFLEETGKRLSRGKRRDNACSALSAAISVLDDQEETDQADDAEELRDTLDNIQSEAESVEFPGMMG